jgi:hypothetical protein
MMYLVCTVVTYKELYYQLIAPIFHLQKYSYMLRLQPVDILGSYNFQRHVQRCFAACQS